LAVQQTALGGTSPRGRASQSRDRRRRLEGQARLVAAGAAGAAVASPCVASVAPPPKSAPPIVRHTSWTETEVFAPTKCGKLRRRKGGGGDENRDPRDSSGGDGARWDKGDGAFGPGEPECPSDGGGADGSDGVFGSGDEGGGGGSNWGSGGGGGGGGGGDGHDEINRWIDGEFVPNDGNLMWAWHTACGVALAGSVQHAVDAALAERRRPCVEPLPLDPAAAACVSSAALERLTAARAGMCLASITSAHALRQQPKLSMSA
jgi:hypothetical protein